MKRLTTASIGALIAGAGLGALLGPSVPAPLLAVSDWFVRAWTGAFMVVVLPLVVFLLFAAIAGNHATSSVKRLGLYVPAVFVGLLVFTAIATTAVASAMLTLPGLRSLSLEALEAAPAAGPSAGAPSLFEMLSPGQLVSSAAGGDIVALMTLTFVAALLAKRISPEARTLLVTLSRALSELMMVAAQALIALAPFIMFALALMMARGSGSGIGTVLLAFVTMKSAACLLVVLLLYPTTAMLGAVPLGRLGRAMVPAQLVALASRSSLATLPPLVEGARGVLGLSERVSGVVLPVAGATLKLSRAFSSPVKLLFLVHVLGLTLTPSQLVIFTVTILLLSPATVGMPQMVSSAKTLPAFVAAGVPAEYVLLLGLTTGITDAFVTVLNATGYMSAAVIVNRWAVGAEMLADGHGRIADLPAAATAVTESLPS